MSLPSIFLEGALQKPIIPQRLAQAGHTLQHTYRAYSERRDTFLNQPHGLYTIYIYIYMYYASFEVLFAVTCTGPDTTRYHVGPRNRRFLSVRPGPGAHEGLLTDTGNPLRPGPWSLSPGTHWQIGNLRSTSSQIPAAAFRTPPPSPLLKEWAEATDPKQGDSPLNNHRNHLLGAGCCPFRDLGQARLES
jgi:hypothetical protein